MIFIKFFYQTVSSQSLYFCWLEKTYIERQVRRTTDLNQSRSPTVILHQSLLIQKPTIKSDKHQQHSVVPQQTAKKLRISTKDTVHNVMSFANKVYTWSGYRSESIISATWSQKDLRRALVYKGVKSLAPHPYHLTLPNFNISLKI